MILNDTKCTKCPNKLKMNKLHDFFFVKKSTKLLSIFWSRKLKRGVTL